MLTKISEGLLGSLASSNGCVYTSWCDVSSLGDTTETLYFFHFRALPEAKAFAIDIAKRVSDGVRVHPSRCNLGHPTYVVMLRVRTKEYENFTREYWVGEPTIAFNKVKHLG